MIVWFVIQMMFASVATLLFANLPTFMTIYTSAIYYYQASIGSFSMDAYSGVDHAGNFMQSLYNIGLVY